MCALVLQSCTEKIQTLWNQKPSKNHMSRTLTCPESQAERVRLEKSSFSNYKLPYKWDKCEDEYRKKFNLKIQGSLNKYTIKWQIATSAQSTTYTTHTALCGGRHHITHPHSKNHTLSKSTHTLNCRSSDSQCSQNASHTSAAPARDMFTKGPDMLLYPEHGTQCVSSHTAVRHRQVQR